MADSQRGEKRDEDQDIGRVGQREEEDRQVVAPQVVSLARAVAADLYNRVLQEDRHADDHDRDASERLDDRHVVLDERHHDRQREQRDGGEHRVGRRGAEPRHEARAVAFAQRALNAEQSDRSERNGGHEADEDSLGINVKPHAVNLGAGISRESVENVRQN